MNRPDITGTIKPHSSSGYRNGWFSYNELKELEMPFTARFVIAHYLETGRFTDMVYGGIADGEKVVFTKLPEF